ncbi:hypothetical protein [Chitinimonas lacunae]|uniref:HAMP domain-containing protein n=1 Tax=Chitinimonas lacunae TaxID=1963018 RepID=A0ABV8MRW5_9NEIS
MTSPSRLRQAFGVAKLRHGLLWEIGLPWLIVITLVCGLAVMLVVSVQEAIVADSKRERFRVTLLELREKIETDLALGFELGDDRGAQERLEQMLAQDGLLQAVEIFDQRGMSLFNTDRGSILERVPGRWLAQIEPGQEWSVSDSGETVIGEPIRNAFGETIGYLAATYLTHHPADEELNRDARLRGFALAGLCIAAAILGFYLRIRRPVQEMLAEVTQLENPDEHTGTALSSAACELKSVLQRLDQAQTRLHQWERAGL